MRTEELSFSSTTLWKIQKTSAYLWWKSSIPFMMLSSPVKPYTTARSGEITFRMPPTSWRLLDAQYKLAESKFRDSQLRLDEDDADILRYLQPWEISGSNFITGEIDLANASESWQICAKWKDLWWVESWDTFGLRWWGPILDFTVIGYRVFVRYLLILCIFNSMYYVLCSTLPQLLPRIPDCSKEYRLYHRVWPGKKSWSESVLYSPNRCCEEQLQFRAWKCCILSHAVGKFWFILSARNHLYLIEWKYCWHNSTCFDTNIWAENICTLSAS